MVMQGVLGGLRVYLNERIGPELAVVHGLLGQVVVAATLLLALMGGHRWNSLVDLAVDWPLRRLATAVAALVFVQIVFGGLLRHMGNPLAQRLHPLLAFAAVAAVVWTVARTFQEVDGAGGLRRPALGLLMLLGIQVVLGIEAWLWVGRGAGQLAPVTVPEAAIRSLHVVVGFGVFGLASLLAARAWKAKLI
jgi:heme A synthase